MLLRLTRKTILFTLFINLLLILMLCFNKNRQNEKTMDYLIGGLENNINEEIRSAKRNNDKYTDTEKNHQKIALNNELAAIMKDYSQDEPSNRIWSNKAKNDNIVIINNRVNKAGSTTLKHLMETMAKQNDFIVYGEGYPRVRSFTLHQKASLEKVVCEAGDKTLYSRHMYYIDTSKWSCTPAYLNMVRDPVSRFISRYYFNRSFLERKSQRYGPNVRRIVRRSLDNCVSQGNHECSYVGVVQPAMSMDANIAYLRTPSISIKQVIPDTNYNIDSQIPFFCGDSDMCRTLGNKTALQDAIHNIDTVFGVVGVLEMLEESLEVMECKFPKFFKGLLSTYRQLKMESVSRNKFSSKNVLAHQNVNKPTVSQKTKDELKRRLAPEYELYEATKKKLKAQLEECRIKNS